MPSYEKKKFRAQFSRQVTILKTLKEIKPSGESMSVDLF